MTRPDAGIQWGVCPTDSPEDPMALHPIVFTGLDRGLDNFQHYKMNDAVVKRI
jgi:hypothetical protein